MHTQWVHNAHPVVVSVMWGVGGGYHDGGGGEYNVGLESVAAMEVVSMMWGSRRRSHDRGSKCCAVRGLGGSNGGGECDVGPGRPSRALAGPGLTLAHPRGDRADPRAPSQGPD